MLELERARAAEIRARKGPHPAEHVEGECEYCTPKSVPTEPTSLHRVPTVNIACDDADEGFCETCRARPREGQYKQCSACRKAAYRERKA